MSTIVPASSSSTKPIPNWLPWALSALVTLLAVLVWGNSFQWHISAISSYQFFPVLGLVGFSLMWAHYMTGFIYKLAHQPQDSLKAYFRYTGYAVLLAILLHPGILIYQRFRDGYGLPPSSYETYVAPGMGWIALLGSISLLAFLAFELHRFFGKKSWWHYVVDAGDVAMLAILYHGLRLGSQLQGGWYQYVWYFYGICLLVVLGFKYREIVQRHLKHSAA